MLQADLIDKDYCPIRTTICKIDEKLAIFGKNKWLMLAYDVEKYYNKEVISLLALYKRVLEKRLLNLNYAETVSTDTIVSRVTVLLNK